MTIHADPPGLARWVLITQVTAPTDREPIKATLEPGGAIRIDRLAARDLSRSRPRALVVLRMGPNFLALDKGM